MRLLIVENLILTPFKKEMKKFINLSSIKCFILTTKWQKPVFLKI